MGHDVHFLRRIERLSPVQADLALTLYREPELIAHMLGRVRLPDGAERVALALEDAPDSPYVIVTRTGRFVTCLGAGMKVSDCPVVSRPQIDHASEKLTAMREALAAGQSELRRLFRRLIERGSGLGREDFTALAAVMPLIAKEVVATAMDICEYLKEFHDEYHHRRYRKVTPAVRAELHYHWASSWALGHLAALCGERADDVQEHPRLSEKLLRSSLNVMLGGTVLFNSAPMVLRAAWAVARAGRVVLDDTRDRLHRARTPAEALAPGMALATMGLRHRRTQAEVARTLAQYTRTLGTAGSPALAVDATRWIMDLLEQQVTKPEVVEKMREDHLFMGRLAFMQLTRHLPEGTPLRYPSSGEVPEALALPALMHLHDELTTDTNSVLWALLTVPWLATASGPALYLPAPLLDQCKSLFDPEALAERFARYHMARASGPPVRAEARAGRNEPCPCGSGKKFKRCCGAAA